MRSFIIPVNFTDAGKLMGAFHIRNAIEAFVLTIPPTLLMLRFLPFSFTTKLMLSITLCVPIAGFALIGVNDDSLSQFLITWLRFRKKRRVITYRGSIMTKKQGKERKNV